MKLTLLLPLLLVIACSSETRPDRAATSTPTADVPLANQGRPMGADTIPPLWKSTLAADYLKPGELKRQYQQYDFSGLWKHDGERPVLGFVGNGYERLRMVVLMVRQDGAQPDLYHVTGKSKVRNTVRPFSGTIRIRHVRELKVPVDPMDAEELRNVQARGEVVGQYEFREEGTGPHTGTFSGMVISSWYLTKDGRIHYDDLTTEGDGYYNNSFAGEWRSHDGKLRMKANWGDYRIPDSGSLDVGTDGFMPDSQYLANGWRSYVQAMSSGDEQEWERERARWW